VDAVEVANAANNDPSFDALAWVYAKRLALPATAGSDIHYAEDIQPGVVFGVYLDKKMETIGDYVAAIKNNAIMKLKIPSERCSLRGDERLMLPVDIRDNRDKSIGNNITEFLEL
jgi:hypothetical protein